MKRVLIYGDSNVWGENLAGPRIPYHLRWANRLRKSSKDDYEIIANGVCGRVAGDFRSNKPECNGKSAFAEIYNNAGSVDIVIIALCTNDLQVRFNRSVDDIVNDLMWYKSVSQGSELVYILPPNFSVSDDSGPEFTIKSQKLRGQIIANKEKLTNCIIVDNIELSDGIHFSANGHKLMAIIVGKKLKEMI